MGLKSFSRAFVPYAVFAVAVTLVSCSRVPGSASASKRAQRAKEFYFVDSFKSTALSRNTLKQNPSRPISIMLPPSYYERPGTRYPVIYFLHGFMENPGMIALYRKYVFKLMSAGNIPQMIIVEPDCTTKYGGGYYVNSPVTGDYEDYLTKELIAFIDANYRTMPVASARGIAGFSMGGFGALTQGLRHPDVFGVVYAIAPVVLAPDGLRAAWDYWSLIPRHFDALASVFSPAKAGARPGRIPTLDGSEADNALCDEWYAGLGDWDKKIAAYLALPVKLRALRISYNTQDRFGYIRVGCEYLHAQLSALGVRHEFESVSNPGHNLTLSLIADDLLPFMGGNLSPAK